MASRHDELLNQARNAHRLFAHRGDYGPGSYPSLKNVLSRLGSNDDLSGLNAAALVPDRRPGPIAAGAVSVLSLLRDVLVFAPIAYTWWSLHQTLTAYHRDTAGTSFFAGWAAGHFAGAAGPIRVSPLGHVAAFIVLLVLVIIALTVLAHVLDGLIARACDQSAVRLQLDPMLAESAVAARIGGASALGGIGAGIGAGGRMSREARELGEQVAGNIAELGKTMGVLNTSIQATVQQDPRQEFAKSMTTWIQTAEALRKATETLAVPAEELRKLLNAQHQLTEAQQRFATMTENLIAQLGGGTQALMQAAHLERGVLTDVGRVMQLLGNTLEQLEHRVGALRGGLDGVTRIGGPAPANGQGYPGGAAGGGYEGGYGGRGGAAGDDFGGWGASAPFPGEPAPTAEPDGRADQPTESDRPDRPNPAEPTTRPAPSEEPDPLTFPDYPGYPDRPGARGRAAARGADPGPRTQAAPPAVPRSQDPYSGVQVDRNAGQADPSPDGER